MTGTIILWYEQVVAIPPGWKLCDGNNGTPDLQDYIPVCAGDDYAVGASGGSVNHLHSFQAAAHQHSPLAGTSFATTPALKQPNTNGEVVTGNSNNASVLPPFKALCYIQYVGF